MTDAIAVQEIFLDCLFSDGESTDNAVKVAGIRATFGFHPQRLDARRDEIKEQLMGLPDEFMATSGGGWSFLNACYDRGGTLWGQHANIEQLLVLGLATGLTTFLLPRDLWDALPGGMPYFVVNDGS